MADESVSSKLEVSSDNSPAETAELTARVEAARSEFDSIRNNIVNLPVYAEITEIASQVEELERKEQALRNRGYAFQTVLESEIAKLGQLWRQTQSQATSQADERVDTLMQAASQTEQFLMQAIGGSSADVLRAEASVKSLRDQQQLVESMLRDRYEDLSATVASVQQPLDSMLWTLDISDQVPKDVEKQGNELGSSLNGKVDALTRELQMLRGRPVAFGDDYGSLIAGLSANWKEARDKVSSATATYLDKLRDATAQFEKLALHQINGVGDDSEIEATKQTLNGQLAELRRMLKDRYDALAHDAEAIEAELTGIKQSLDQLEQASFELGPDERLAVAAQACLLEDAADDEGPKGHLFLTDQRILFEQKEKVATKRFLGIATESELRQEILFETSLEPIKTARSRDAKKFLGLARRELLDLELDGEASRHKLTVELFDTSNEKWITWIEKAKRGELQRAD